MLPFDVFLSYNRSDRDAALSLTSELEKMGLRVFLDVRRLRPGIDWARELEEAVRCAPAVAVLVGPEDIGPTQDREVNAALERQAAPRQSGKALPVIPVILPGARPSTRTFVNQNTWINLTDGIGNASELDRLYFGITGQQRVRPQIVPPERSPQALVSPVETVVRNLVPRLGEGGVSFFLGGGVSRPPTPYELAVAITNHVRRDNPGVPDIHMLDVAGSCYAVDRGGEELAVEDSIREILAEQVTELAPPLHMTLAKLARTLSTFTNGRGPGAGGRPPAPGETRRPDQHNARPLIIVCTTYDLAMERALLREGVSFIRLVQNQAKRTVDVGEYDVARAMNVIQFLAKNRDAVVVEHEVDRDSQRALDEAIASFGLRAERGGKAGRRPSKLPFVMSRTGQVPEVVLYKPLGSQDVLGSCFISSDHHLELVLRALKTGGVPDQITEIVRNNRIVFLGYSFFDPILRLLRHTLLLDRTWSVPSYVVKTSPADDEASFDLRLEAALWNDVRTAWPTKGMTLVESAELEFVDALLVQFAARHGAAHV